MPKKIERLEIEKLFGRFKYTIDLSSKENGLAILTAPNGYGKSTILRIIRSFASGDYYYFIRERFESIKFFISGELPLEILHLAEDKGSSCVRC